MNKVRFGIIGIGHIGKRHASILLQNEEAELVAVCDIQNEAMTSLPSEVKKTTDIHTFLQDKSIDIICVCTPNYLHKTHAEAVLLAGKNVLIEKPMALHSGDCQALIETAKQKGKKIFCVMQNRYSPNGILAKKLIQNGELGNISMIQINCIWNRDQAYYQQSNWRGNLATDGGVIFTQFSHFIDMLYYLNGPIAKIHSGIIRNFQHPFIEIEDSGSFVMEADNGAIVNFNYSTCAYAHNMEIGLTILGSKGSIRFGGPYFNTIEYHALEKPLEEIHEIGKPNDYGFYNGSMNNHPIVLQHIIDNLKGKNQSETSAEDGLAVVKIIESMYQNANRK